MRVDITRQFAVVFELYRGRGRPQRNATQLRCPPKTRSATGQPGALRGPVKTRSCNATHEKYPTQHRFSLHRRRHLRPYAANSQRAPPHFVGHGSAARPPHQIGGCGFKPSVVPRSVPAARGPRAHRPVENWPTAHGARARTAHRELRLWSGPTRDALLRSSMAEAPPHGHRIRSAAAALHRQQYRIQPPSDCARPARSSPRAESDDSPRSTRAHCAVWTWLWCKPTRDAPLPSSLAEAQPYGHRNASAAATSDRRCYRVRSPRRAARALIAPCRIGRQPTKHTCALRGADFVVVRADSRHSPPQFVGRGSAVRPPQRVGGCDFGPSVLSR